MTEVAGVLDDEGGEQQQRNQIGNCHQPVENIRDRPDCLQLHGAAEPDVSPRDRNTG